jgi:hypothetical protein
MDIDFDFSKALALSLPALSLVYKNLPASTPPWISLLLKVTLTGLELAAQKVAPAALQAHLPVQHRFGLPASVVMPPEHEFTEPGLEAWSKAQVQSMP